MNGFFIDKLVMHQDHSDAIPVVGKTLCIEHDLQTGEFIHQSPKSLTVEGSYSTKLQIRSNGTRVSVSGNPSRYNRLDNLFGLSNIDSCVNVYNQILAEYGLPPFTKNKIEFSQQGDKSKRLYNGAVITAIDLTKNHYVGKGNELLFLRGVSSQSVGRGKSGFLYPDGNTASWGYSSYRPYIIYNKAADLRLRSSKILKNALPEDIEYFNQLINFCESNGVVREEYKFKRQYLQKHDLRYYGLFKENDFIKHLGELDRIIERCKISGEQSMTIADKLLQNEIVKSRQAANATQSYAMLWMQGVDIKSQLKRSQYYEHKSRLKAVGIDINVPFDVTRMSPMRIKQTEIEISQLVPPNWYRHAQNHTLRIA
ncbi:phage/plasmid replication domain-containing protein [Pseudoalteromonas spongiae]|uniref:phage/plasmid replication domain-containing protein n=1 Tax=Pseudoalteromonas spongiae TaxID=298657 RepID=UPI00110B56CB|nr:phage/plasmid replication protein [Pseudoalteromonas spongiae]TMO84591.1 hypothetical protein CWC15_09895 [Pseudoalteromonas spongiae]